MNREKQLQLYQTFIINCTTNAKSVRNYSDFKRINECLEILFPEKKGISVLDFDDPVAFENVMNELIRSPQFIEYNNKGNNQYSNTIKHYLKFLYAKKIFSDTSKETIAKNDSNLLLQQIFYGAPGTGKSHKIKENEYVKKADEKNLVFRTTFHPDSDYSTFVGAYKPTMDKKAVRNVAGDIVKNTDKKEVYEDCIIYSFIPQAFLQSYVAAWNNNPNEKVFLIIEEINRGNCAQIFGDLFQLLDRDCNGFSEYPIMADKDLAKYLNGKDENGQDVLTNKEGIKDGKLRLPKNLYIWATMNTSDQSLFPIDSAFKRRWDWKYVPIDTRKEDWYIQIGDSYYSWTSFLEKVNNELLTDETAEDKHLGFYFCKANDGIISKETFVSKVLFYLWTDVFKIYGIPSAIGSSKDWLFTKFYNTDGLVNETMVKKLLEKLGIENEDTAKREQSLIDTEKMENAAVNDKKNHPKEIRFEDGTSIDTTTKVFDAYIKAIEKIGIEKIATVVDKLKYRRKEHPLISKEKYPELDGKGGFSYHQIGDYYFVKGTKAYTYVRILEDLEKMLKVGMTVVCV